jgi:tetratricopeptide (TPR) repeat protein
MPPAPSVFISYSHQDEVWKNRLLDHLGGLEEEGLLATWNDRNLGAGDDWFEAIRKAMDEAEVAVLLVSAHSLKSKFIRHQEIPHLLDRRVRAGMTFFPVLVRSCVWDEFPWLSRFQARPADGKPLAAFQGDRRDAELAKIAKEILGIVRNGTPPPQPSKEPDLPRSHAPAALHQLPTPPADFIGRQEDLDFLRSHLAPGKPGAIFGLRGMGGIGKTTLALKLAAELKPEFPDAQIYLDLKGVDPQPLTAAQAMAHVIRSFHPESRLPEGDAEVAGLYHTVLDGKRVLLLMDNAAGQEQVQPLIPPSTCLLLVTSRFRFALPGLVDRDLDEMSETEAWDLLVKIAPRIGDAAGEIARLCGRLPLALRLAGSALAERRSLSAAEYVRRLKEGKVRFGDVDVSLNLSYDLLDKEQRRLWRLLAVFPSTFDVSAAAAIWELESEGAQSLLEELVRSSLVEWEKTEERYRLHDLARDFAKKCLKAAEREAGQRRISKHFLGVLDAARIMYLQGGDSIQIALRTLDAEWGNIQVGHEWSARNAEKDTEAARICSDYPDIGTYILTIRQGTHERVRWRELGLAAARQAEDKAAEGCHLGNLGLVYAELGEIRRAIEFHEQSLAIAREIGDRRSESQNLGNLGNAFADLGETRRAIEFYEQSLAITREIGDRFGEGITCWNLGLVYEEEGDFARAAELWEGVVDFERESGHADAEKDAARVAALRARIAEQKP